MCVVSSTWTFAAFFGYVRPRDTPSHAQRVFLRVQQRAGVARLFLCQFLISCVFFSVFSSLHGLRTCRAAQTCAYAPLFRLSWVVAIVMPNPTQRQSLALRGEIRRSAESDHLSVKLRSAHFVAERRSNAVFFFVQYRGQHGVDSNIDRRRNDLVSRNASFVKHFGQKLDFSFGLVRLVLFDAFTFHHIHLMRTEFVRWAHVGPFRYPPQAGRLAKSFLRVANPRYPPP